MECNLGISALQNCGFKYFVVRILKYCCTDESQNTNLYL